MGRTTGLLGFLRAPSIWRSFLFFAKVGCGVFALASLLTGMCVAAPVATGADTKALPLSDTLKELRKQSLVALALPPQATGIRAEHKKFLDRLTTTLKQVPDGDAGSKALVLFLRGQLQRHLQKFAAARADYDACLAASANLPVELAARQAGLPSANSLKAYRAMTLLEDGDEAVLRELEAIPFDPQAPFYHEVGDMLTAWAEKLVDTEKFKEAIRAFQCIERLHLWTDEADSPKQRIEMLRLQAKNRGQ